MKGDQGAYQEIARKRSDIVSGVQPKPVTAEDVQNIISSKKEQKEAVLSLDLGRQVSRNTPGTIRSTLP